MQTPPACQCLTKIMSLWKLTSKTKAHRQSSHRVIGLQAVFTNPFLSGSIVVTKKDTGDIVEEILILETALLTDFIHCL